MLLLAASLFLTQPAPLDMPRAEGYLVSEGDAAWFEDRFERFDLWLSRTVDGRWVDDDGRVFMTSTILCAPPPEDTGAVITRSDYVATCEKSFDKRDHKKLREAIVALTGLELPEKPQPPRQLPRGYKDVDYYEGTNADFIVCACLREKSKLWQVISWKLVEGDDHDEFVKLFENEYLGKRWLQPTNCVRKVAGERELLREDARHAVGAYPAWRVTGATEFTVIDDLPNAERFRRTLTNDLSVMRRKYAEVLPTSLTVTNTLAVARIYANRDEYLEALETSGETNMVWSAAYWSPQRRELVAYLPQNGETELLQTIRHEAFHQYLSYATAFLPTSPWLNEGYAQYFEGSEDAHACVRDYDANKLDELAKILPALFMMDYGEFYAGSDQARRLKYKLAKMVVIFIEQGVDKIRFQPFKNLKADYFKTLLKTHRPDEATQAVFRNQDTLDLFVNEWKRFWKNM